MKSITDVSAMVVALVNSGMSETDIAKECDCAQSTINRLVRGVTADPRYSLVLAIENLCISRNVQGVDSLVFCKESV